MNASDGSSNLRVIARRAMKSHGLEPEFPPEVLKQLQSIKGPAHDTDGRSAICVDCSGARSTTTRRAILTS